MIDDAGMADRDGDGPHIQVWRDVVIVAIRETVEQQVGQWSDAIPSSELIDSLVLVLEEREQTIASALYAIGKHFGIDGRDIGQAFSDSGMTQTHPHGSRPFRALASDRVPITVLRARPTDDGDSQPER